MNQKNMVWPDVVSRDPDAVMLVDEEFVELMADEDPEELAESICLDWQERQCTEEFENRLDGDGQ